MSERKPTSTVISSIPSYSGETNPNPVARTRALMTAGSTARHLAEILCYQLGGGIEMVADEFTTTYKVVERFTDRVVAVVLATTSNDTGYWKPVVERVL